MRTLLGTVKRDLEEYFDKVLVPKGFMLKLRLTNKRYFLICFKEHGYLPSHHPIPFSSSLRNSGYEHFFLTSGRAS